MPEENQTAPLKVRMRRRQFLKLALLLGSGSSLWGYGKFVGSKYFDVAETEIPISGLTNKLRILHLGDFHYSSANPLWLVKQAVELGLAKNPDLICCTGDFITAGSAHDLEAYSKFLRESLPNNVPKFACLGNHDGGEWSRHAGGYSSSADIIRFLGDSGFQVLHNETHKIDIHGQPITLIGVGDLWSGELDAAKAFAAAGEEPSPRILLAHNPDSKGEVKTYLWDLMLSGHTHGGQIVIPFFGPIFTPVRDKRFVHGLNSWNDRLIYVTRGVGSLFGIRINCRPEVSILDLVPSR